MNTKIYIKYFDDDCCVEQHGDWIDLKAREDVSLDAGEYYQIPLGVAMKLPGGYEAHMVPRSSTFRKYGIIQTNSVGIIDNAYCGDDDEWAMPVYALRSCTIHKGDRIAQFRIVEKMDAGVLLCPVRNLNTPNRGGFGSTGD